MEGGKAWFQTEKDAVRRRLFKYALEAFSNLPLPERPRVLDVGCGSGVTAIELVKTTGCTLTCIDIDREMLDWLSEKARQEGIEDRLKIVQMSLLDMNFPDESFDVILAEGSIFAIGFEKGLLEWKRLLRPGGFMVIHDEQGDVREKIGLIQSSGYDLLGHCVVDADVWRREYCVPLENLVMEAEENYSGGQDIAGALDNARGEIKWFKDFPERSSSVIFTVKKAK